jgi:parallel beta-helix repeat protein
LNLWIDGNGANQIRTGDMMRQGILTLGSNKVLIDNVHLTNMTECGVDVAYSFNVTIQNSSFSGCGDGDIWIDIDSFNVIVRNNTCNTLYVVDFGGLMNDITISSNTINNGILEVYQGGILSPYNITISKNIIINPKNIGIYVQGCRNVTISDNFLSKNESGYSGFQLSSNNGTIVTGNQVSGFSYGLTSVVGANPSNNTIVYNDFRGNLQAINDNISVTHDIVHDNLGVS